MIKIKVIMLLIEQIEDIVCKMVDIDHFERTMLKIAKQINKKYGIKNTCN